MDARLLLTAPTQASESDSFRKIELLDALCAMEEEAEEEEKGSEEEEAERAEAEAQAVRGRPGAPGPHRRCLQ